MTEVEWLACENPEAMLDHWLDEDDPYSERKWRLVTVAVWRRYRLYLPSDPDLWEIVGENEIAADHPESPEAERLIAQDMLALNRADAWEWALSGAWGISPSDHPEEFAAQAKL